MQAQLGPEWPDFLAALEQPPPVSIRLNAAKGFFAHPLEAGVVPWCRSGRYLESRPSFTLDPAYHAGAYYVQEASSMLIEAALRQLVDLKANLRVLDLCAAPGGKTTLLASLLSEKSILIANEVIKSRIGMLRENCTRWGDPNIWTTNLDSAQFSGLAGYFDLILVDAPCSGEGLFRKDPAARSEWSADKVQLCAGRQQRILQEAIPLLASDGVLLYSTCTYNAFENEAQVRWLEQQGLKRCSLQLDPAWGIRQQDGGYQCYPHRVRGEGFFLAALQREEQAVKPCFKGRKMGWRVLTKAQRALVDPWLEDPAGWSLWQDLRGQVHAIPGDRVAEAEILFAHLRQLRLGVELGSLKGTIFIPSHALALSSVIANKLPSQELNLEQALQYLRKEMMDLPHPDQKGWTLARYQGRNLGWYKHLGNRINNYFPKEWRIRMGR